jgi:choline dehydrogenase-like flavoprotein
MLATDWKSRKKSYDFIIIGSGYGGSINAARIASAGLNRSVCILERGREWPIETFPDTLASGLAATRSSANPLGLYEFLNYRDISVIKGSGLGGTSLINANVAIVPDPEIFEQVDWPRSLNRETLLPYYERARKTLAATPHPRGGHNEPPTQLAKVKALDRRAQQIGTRAFPLDIAVNFTIDGPNEYGVQQKPCIDCGDCISGCKVGAKNTLYMNYLPIAAKAGAQIFTQTKVEWIEKLSGGGWRIHGKHYKNQHDSDSFTMDAKNVVLGAGAINSTEILLRSEMHGLPVSPALGTGFSGNGDFFGLAYNGDFVTDVLGYGLRPSQPGKAVPPGPTIVGAVRYNGTAPLNERILVEDLSFPSSYVLGAKIAFAAIRGEDTDVGDEAAERRRIQQDLDIADLYNRDGALNHTMLYLVMGHDDARGTMVFEAPWNEPDGRMKIEWDGAGRQVVFTRINEELRRHARALGASFISNPLWNIFDSRHLITAHPLGGCPIGEDYIHGAVDEFGRVFSGDGSVHEGLFVSDGALIPSALGVNPFLTISAFAERIAERKIREMQGDPYPAPKPAVSVSAIDPLEAIGFSEGRLEALFRRCQTRSIGVMVNQGTGSEIDSAKRTIKNDRYWKGFFPKGHVLNLMSSAIFTGFKKEFKKQGNRYTGLTSDTDGRITARNSLEEITLTERKGTLDPGKYILLKYLDFPWTGYYDIFKVINEDLLIGRVYLGQYPNGIRIFTFPMTRRYGFDQMTVDDHRALYKASAAPTPQQLDGVWRMDIISNANQVASAAYLKFDLKPDGRLESRYNLMGLMEGLVVPRFVQDHFQLEDFTPFHDEIRRVDDNLLVGKYVTDLPPDIEPLFGTASLGIFHIETSEGQGKRVGFYYLLSKVEQNEFPTTTLLRPFLDVHMPDGIGMTFDEEMVGWYFEGASTPSEGRAGDLTIADRIPASGNPAGGVGCKFNARMVVKDLNEFIEGREHEAQIIGTISFDQLQGQAPVLCRIDERRSRFNYLRVNEQTGEAQMLYHIEFRMDNGREFTFDGLKYMQKDEGGGLRGTREVLNDYTTLFCHVYERNGDKIVKEIGIAYLKFRTFEDVAATGSLVEFLRSFRVTGTGDPLLQLQAQMRFMAFTAQFVQQEYDPLAPDIAGLRQVVRAEVLRGADTPDFFSTLPTADLQAILHDTPTQPIEKLVNTGEVHYDFQKKRIFRDSFWKGSFAKDTLLGWEERIRNAALGSSAEKAGAIFAGGSFWKRFDEVKAGVATGHVVNYEMEFLPGKPVVKQVAYPKNNRRYFKQGDPVLLLNYVNDPYKIVYDTIKIIDDNNAIGVMHLGDFPDGIEFSTFVMARHNYPFEKMSIEDHHQIFSDARTRVPTAAQLEGKWDGSLILLARPNTSLLNQLNPTAFRLRFKTVGDKVEGRYRFGLLSGEMKVEFTDEFMRLVDFTAFHDEVRLIDDDTLIGKWVSPEMSQMLLRGLQHYVEPGAHRVAFYYILNRVK